MAVASCCALALRAPYLLLSLLLFLLPFRAQAAGQTYQQVVPYTPIEAGVPAMDVVFNGKVKARVIVDSGSSYSGITDQLAAKLGLQNGPFIQPPNGPLTLDGKPMKVVKVDRMDIGLFHFDNCPYVILDSKVMATITSGIEIDGIIGADALTVFPAMFDFQRHQVTFYSQSLSSNDLAAVGMSDAAVVPLSGTKDDFVCTCPVDLQSGTHRAEANLLIDTGGANTVLSQDIAGELKLTSDAPPDQYLTYQTDFNITPIVIDTTSIGGVPSKYLTINYSPGKPSPDQPQLLGLDVLTHYQILLDYRQKVMYIKPAAGEPAAMAPSVQIKTH